MRLGSEGQGFEATPGEGEVGVAGRRVGHLPPDLPPPPPTHTQHAGARRPPGSARRRGGACLQAPQATASSVPRGPPRPAAHREVDGGLVSAGGQVPPQEDGVAHLQQF